VVGNVLEDPRWTQIGGLSTGYTSVITVPLMVGEEMLGVVTLGHPEVDAFTAEDQEMAQAAAMQMAVAINNAELFNLIRDQAEGLGTMLRTQQVEASRSMAILEAVADGVLVTDDSGQITLFNHSAQTILRLPDTAVIGKSLEDFTGLFGHAAQAWMDTIRGWASDPASFQVGETYAERITLDKQRVVAIHLAPVSLGEEFLGTVTIFRDITHQVEVDRLKSEFVATVSHELRTPMTSIKGYVDILLMGAAGQLTQQQTSFLDIVKTNTERLNILVNDLLDVSRIEAGKLELAITPLNLGAMIEEVVGEMRLRSDKENRPMEFVLDVPPNLPRVPADEERLLQILDNLVSNAYLYTPAGGRVEVQVTATEKEVQVHVIDNGIGVHLDDHERIFERFFRGEDPLVLASSGNGLGLSIARQLVNMHRGRLWLQSEGIPGEGSTFSFTMPLEPPQAELEA
jgi:PAS domain S-box-containing protein